MLARRTTGSLIATLLLAAPAAFAGVVWESRQVTADKDAPPMLRTVRIRSDAMRVDGGQQSVIVRLDLGLLWTIDHEGKTYQELRFDELGQAMQNMQATIDKLPPEQQAMAKETIKNWASPLNKIDVAPSGEKKTVAGHPCEVYKIEGGPVRSSICAATDLKPSSEARSFYTAMAERMARTPGLESLRGQAEAYSKIEGVAVEERSIMKTPSGERSDVFELVSYKDKELEPAVFDLPASLKQLPGLLEQLKPGAAAKP